MINADTRAVIVRTSVRFERGGIGAWARERPFFLGNAYAEAVRENGCPYLRSPVRYWGPHRADLAIGKVAIGNDGINHARYIVTVTNLGPDPADGVVVTDDPETTFAATGSDPRCGPDGGGVFSCAIGTLTAGSVTSLLVKTICVVPNVNSAAVASATYDPNSANNSVSNVASGPCPA